MDGWVALVVLVIVGVIVAVVVTRPGITGKGGKGRDSLVPPPAQGEEKAVDTTGTSAAGGGPAAPPPPTRLAAVVVNPTKFDDLDAVRTQLEAVATERGWAPPLLIETTEEDNGTGQAIEAIEKGAEVVCALGGDGTVRAVAAGLVDTDTPLGLLPGGTGNLLARNMGLPIDDLSEAFRVCLDGENRRIDVGTINVIVPGSTQDQAKDYFFLVMAGVGFDADVMAQAPEDLKAKVGWAAYLVSGAKNLNGSRFGVTVKIDGNRPHHRRIRSVVIGNCGKLQGGVQLLPDAEIDDGHLDAVLLAPKGIIGWGTVAARVVTKQRKGHAMVEHHRCESMVVTLDKAQEVQLDGDPIGPGQVLTTAVKPLALSVRAIPEPAE